MSSHRYLAEAKRSQGAEVERTYMLGDSAKSEMTEAQIKDHIKEVCTHPMYPSSAPSFQIHAPAYTAQSDAIMCAQAGPFFFFFPACWWAMRSLACSLARWLLSNAHSFLPMRCLPRNHSSG